MQTHKTCSSCFTKKPLADFHKSKRYFDGRVQKCKSCVKLYSKEYYNRNPGKHKEYNASNLHFREIYHKNYNLKNRKVFAAIRRLRIATEPEFKMLESCRRRIHNALNLTNTKKRNRTIDLIGCSIEFLKLHLESQFQTGMTWNSYGKYGWHIDHRRPCALFDLTQVSEQFKCFHYSNLQPLWASDNLRKSDNYYETEVQICQ